MFITTSYGRNAILSWGVIKFRGDNFRSLSAKVVQVFGNVISCNLFYLQNEIWLYYPNLFFVRGKSWKHDSITLFYYFVEDVNSWIKGTHEFHENWTFAESNDSTVYVSESNHGSFLNLEIWCQIVQAYDVNAFNVAKVLIDHLK